MDNNMNSMLSLIMITIGFVNGFVWANLLKAIDLNKAKQEAHTERVSRIEAEIYVEELELKNKLLKDVIAEQEEKLKAIQKIVSLPAPSTPLARCTQVTEGEESPIVTPKTPSVLSNTD